MHTILVLNSPGPPRSPRFSRFTLVSRPQNTLRRDEDDVPESVIWLQRIESKMRLPNWWEAPRALLDTDGHCGLLAAWMVLRHFGKRVSARAVTEDCRYTKRHGVFTIGLATCLKLHGVHVSFHTDPDPAIGGYEKRCYARAAQLGIHPGPAIDLAALGLAVRQGQVPIVLFNSETGVGHFSPLVGLRKGRVELPLADGESIRKSTFLTRWSEQGINRQCVIAGN